MLKVKVAAYVELVRPHNILAVALSTILGYSVASRALGVPPNLVDLLMACSVVTLVAAGGYAINDYFDYKVDLINKPYRPIPSGRVTLGEVLRFSIALGVVGVALSTYFGVLSLLYVSLNSLLVYTYSAKIKETGFLGNVVVSLEGAATIVYGSLVVYLRTGTAEALLASLVPASIAFTLLLGREVVKTIEDYYADAERNVRSLPRTIGLKASAVVASVILLAVPPLSILPALSGYYNRFIYIPLTAITLVLVVHSSARMMLSSNKVSTATKVRSELKVAVFTGILALLISSVAATS